MHHGEIEGSGFEIIDPEFAGCFVGHARLERLWTGCRWAEGPVWVGGETLSHYTATVYPGPKGNWVFNAATIFWCQALSHPPGHTLPWSHWSRPHGPDERVQKITLNFLNKVLS